jgi:hypothetical protein
LASSIHTRKTPQFSITQCMTSWSLGRVTLVSGRKHTSHMLNTSIRRQHVTLSKNGRIFWCSSLILALNSAYHIY